MISIIPLNTRLPNSLIFPPRTILPSPHPPRPLARWPCSLQRPKHRQNSLLATKEQPMPSDSPPTSRHIKHAQTVGQTTTVTCSFSPSPFTLPVIFPSAAERFPLLPDAVVNHEDELCIPSCCQCLSFSYFVSFSSSFPIFFFAPCVNHFLMPAYLHSHLSFPLPRYLEIISPCSSSNPRKYSQGRQPVPNFNLY